MLHKLCFILVLLISGVVGAESRGTSAGSLGLGDTYTCILLDDQSVRCWGFGGGGRFGYDVGGRYVTESAKAPPLDLGKNKFGQPYRAVSLSSAKDHTCAVLDDGMVKCWGSNFLGQSGYTPEQLKNNREVNNVAILDPVDLSYKRDKTPYKVTTLVSGARKTCAIIDDGNVECFGDTQKIDQTIDNDKRQLEYTLQNIKRYEEEIDKAQVVEERDPGRRKRDADAQLEQDLKDAKDALKRDLKEIDQRYSKDKQRRNSKKNSAKQAAKNREDLAKRKYQEALDRFTVEQRERKRNLDQLRAVGNNQALTYEADVKALLNPIVDLGLDPNGMPYKAVQVAIGESHTCVILNDGLVKCWGSNDFGQLGTVNGSELPREAKPLFFGAKLNGQPLKAHSIYSRDNMTCVVLDDQALRCWGNDGFTGRLIKNAGTIRTGTARTTSSLDENPVYELGTDAQGVPLKVTSVGLAARTTCALIQNGGVKCWGDNGSGLLGLGDTLNRFYDKEMSGNKLLYSDLGFEADALSCGEIHCCATNRVNHVMKCWGNNGNYALGTGDQNNLGTSKDQVGDEMPFVNLGLLHSVYFQ